MADKTSGGAQIMRALRNINILLKRQFLRSETKTVLDNATGTHGFIVCYLGEKAREGSTVFQRDIEKRFSMRRSSATAVLQLMEKNGLITRTTAENDGRLKKIMLTDKAESLCRVFECERDALDNRVVSGLTEDEIELLIQLLSKMQENLSQERDD